jgi:hypothetical protein
MNRWKSALQSPGRWACGLALALCCSVGGAQHMHPPAVSAAPAMAAASASKPAARKPRPALGVGVAVSPDGALWLAGLDGQGRLFVQNAPAPQGTASLHWSAPRVLDTAGDAISADGENHPKLVFGPQGTVLIAYTQPLAKPNTGYVRLLRSVDGGQHFAAPVTVHADRQIITHRFESMGFDAEGVLHTVWIDKRDLEAAPKVGGKSSYRGAAIYRNISRDGGATFGPDTKVADHSCECCRIALGVGSDGAMRALWRHVFEPNVRDHAIAVLRGVRPLSTWCAPPTTSGGWMAARTTARRWRRRPMVSIRSGSVSARKARTRCPVYATPGWPRTARPGCRRSAPCRMRAPNMPT